MTNPLVDDRFLLTSDTLFIDSVGRPDLGGRAKTCPPAVPLAATAADLAR